MPGKIFSIENMNASRNVLERKEAYDGIFGFYNSDYWNSCYCKCF